MTPTADSTGQRYVQLALAIDQHIPGYIDAYFGPVEWKEAATSRGKRPLDELAGEAVSLEQEISKTTQNNPQRSDFLSRQLRAMSISLKLLHGEKMSLAQEVEALYDISPSWVSESRFEEGHQLLEEMLPPGESLQERMVIHRKSLEISVENAKPVVAMIIGHLQKLTKDRFTLPSEEQFELQYVNGQPWAAYNWYLGNCRSRIDINTDLPLRITALTGLIAHEGYPGHHTELSIKETSLVNQKGLIEHGLALINAPQCLISEGIATQALDVIMSEADQIAWNAEQVFPGGGFVNLDARREHEIGKASQKLSGVEGNAAFMLHDQGADRGEVISYLQRYSLVEEDRARKIVDFISNPLFRSYIFNYSYGRELLGALFDQKGDIDYWFKRLLSEAVTPSQIREWMAAD
jgi:hypothetical protein